MIERICNGEEELAIVIRSSFDKKGIEFVTPDEYSQQMAYMHHEKGHKIIPHFHNLVLRKVHYTQEVLVIKSGKVLVKFYDKDCRYVCETVIGTGDIILLASGGHGFEMLEETVMVEIKQGPYVGENDKTRFEPKE